MSKPREYPPDASPKGASGIQVNADMPCISWVAPGFLSAAAKSEDEHTRRLLARPGVHKLGVLDMLKLEGLGR